MRQIAVRAATGIVLVCAWALSACSTTLDNGLDGIPPVRITESQRVALTAGAVGGTGLTVTDESSGASVNIPAGTVISLDASASDDIGGVIPESIVVALRPISQYLANQNGDLLTVDGLNLPNLTKVGALAVLPVIGRTSGDITITIPVAEVATGELRVWHFEPDDVANGDGELVAHPSVGHWRPVGGTTTATGGRVTFTTNTFGQFLVTTQAATGGGGTAPTVTLTATPTTGEAPLAVTFTATATDSDGTIAKYEWDFEGDGIINTETTDGTATHTYTVEDQFDAEVTVTDNEGDTATATVRIGVGNAAPTITAVAPLTATTGQPVTLTVTASDPDTDGSIANYKWDLDNDGVFEVDSLGEPSTVATFATEGTQTIGVQVTDNEGATDDADFDIVVTAGTTAPTAELTADPEEGVLDENSELPVTFTVELTPDTVVPASVTYDFGDESDTETLTEDPLTTTHTYETDGTFTVTATITPEGGGANIVATTDVIVHPEGTVLATLTATPEEGTLVDDALEVAFAVTLTPDTATAESATYDFGDESDPVTVTEDPLTTTHTYATAGTFTATVTVTPTGGGADISDTTTVTVLPGGTVTATLTATPEEGELVDDALEVNFAVTLTPETASVESATYDFDDGSAPRTITENPLTASHIYSEPGVYEVTVTLIPMGGGDSFGDSTTVTVTEAGSGENQAPEAVLLAVPIAGNPRGFNLNAESSSDPDGDELTFAWEWDDDPTPNSVDSSTTVIFSESEDGQPQTITLTVTDSEGNFDTATEEVTPTAPPA